MSFKYDNKHSVLVPTCQSISHDAIGYNELASLSATLQTLNGVPVVLDFTSVQFFSANLCSVLGSIILRFGHQKINIIGLQPQVDTIFRRNGFNKILGGDPLSDGWGSTMGFQVFDSKSGIKMINKYFVDELAGKVLPTMSDGFWQTLLNSFSEIYENSCYHSQTEEYYCVCGQYFPTKNQLLITYTDTGIGIRQCFLNRFKEDINSGEAIEWAVTKGNTTSTSINGGNGLAIVRRFLELNGGGFRIVSDNGHWYQNGSNQPVIVDLNSRFYGTIITLEINTSNSNSYMLKSEIEEIPF